MADEAITYMKRVDNLAPDQPFFVYYVPGAAHAPHHATPEWITKATQLKLFDQGWNRLREQIFANQQRLGVIPQNARLTPWPKDLLKDWEALSADEQRLFIRQAEVYAAYLMYADHEIGRVIQAVDDLGRLDNTLIIYISGDNGSSAEGTMVGTPNEVATFNGVEIPVGVQLARFYDLWGSDKTYPHMAAPWAWAFSTPFSWTKQIASHFGGTRQGMAISWPAVIKDHGSIRGQFHHVIDVTPTILETAGVRAPEVVDGIKQSPIEGVSMRYGFDARNAAAPSPHQTQYFEMMGDRALYHDGWMAGTAVVRPPWDLLSPARDPLAFPWELYDLRHDWTQSENVADRHRDKLKELQGMFWEEAQRHQVLPLDSSFLTRGGTLRPSPTAGRDTFTWTGELTGTPMGAAPGILNASYNLKAEIEVPQGGAEGMLITQGGRFGGFGFYLLKGRPVFLWNLVDMKRVRWEGGEPLAPGRHILEFDFQYDGLGQATLAFNSVSGIGRGGTGVLKVDGRELAVQRMDKTLPLTMQWDENLDVGADTGTGVDDGDYQVPFRFSGTLERLTLRIDQPKLTPEDERTLMEAQRKMETRE
ncbi:sulfatase-like hydrolase/transferase [Candidatus Thiodictyon syntrophicum]|jgi:arylsulfatase|uniref:sulfatase-like hydrolase/transferase n=1 Tax=Candidatus Thiodictyon syntrophicum TaxID=1166950 RepID=UPI001F02BF6D|nr:sulfatase-like hydrolase/transferase [Candidatus Thiodictyon syntrophicum]